MPKAITEATNIGSYGLFATPNHCYCIRVQLCPPGDSAALSTGAEVTVILFKLAQVVV